MCYDCHLSYSSTRWIDAVIPDNIWITISPTGNEGGLLCIGCIARRLVNLGLENIPVSLNSGPFQWED